MTKFEDLVNNVKINELLHKNKVEEERKGRVLWVLAIIGAIASIATIAFFVYRYFFNDYMTDFDGDFDYDELDDDFDYDEVPPVKEETKND